MILKFQRHPANPAGVILHVGGVLTTFAVGDTIVVIDQPYRDALEANNMMVD